MNTKNFSEMLILVGIFISFIMFSFSDWKAGGFIGNIRYSNLFVFERDQELDKDALAFYKAVDEVNSNVRLGAFNTSLNARLEASYARLERTKHLTKGAKYKLFYGNYGLLKSSQEASYLESLKGADTLYLPLRYAITFPLLLLIIGIMIRRDIIKESFLIKHLSFIKK